MISFACFSPHPPLLLSSVGSKEDRKKVKKTIESLKNLGEMFKKINPDSILISSPHPDWGIKVPLHFLISNIKNQKSKTQFKIQNYQNPDNPVIEPNTICPIMTTIDSPKQHFEWGKQIYKSKIKNCKLKIAIIASGDLSHCLKKEGPYGFNPQGPEFDKALIEFLKKKDIENFLKLDEMFPEAGECGLRSFSFILGILETAKPDWQAKILSYEGPFGVGYLVVNFEL